MVLWEVTWCSMMNMKEHFRETSHVMVENGGSRFTEHSNNCLSNYIVLHPKKTIILFVCVSSPHNKFSVDGFSQNLVEHHAIRVNSLIICCLPNVEAFQHRYTDTKTTQMWDHEILIQLTQCY